MCRLIHDRHHSGVEGQRYRIPYAFRHGNSTTMASNEVNASDAVRMGRLGHTTLATTQGYTHRLADEDYRVAESLERLISGGAQ